MDTPSATRFPTPLVLTGVAASTLLPQAADTVLAAVQQASLPWPQSKKMRKFMGKQDHLAVITAAQAV